MNEKDYLYDLLVHDLVGPLAVVATTVDSLLTKTERYGDLSERQRECLERIRRNTQKARGFVLVCGLVIAECGIRNAKQFAFIPRSGFSNLQS